MGALRGGVAIWLISLALAALWLIQQRYHPAVLVTSFVAVPALTAIGALLGACFGLVFAFSGKRQGILRAGRSQAAWPPLLPETLAFVVGTAVIVVGTTTWALIERRPIVRLESLGGHLGYRTGAVSFPDGALSDAGLPVVVDCLSRTREWHRLSLNGTRVTGDGLRHLQALSNRNYSLDLSTDQLDDSGLMHLGRMTNIVHLYVVGPPLPQGTRERVRRALPNAQRIAFAADFGM
jgi:hypothetical protein